MTREHILDEIRRTAQANGGVPLGVSRFFQETGIRQADWHGKLWARWGDALREAGYAPNTLRGSFDSAFLLERFIALAREIGHVPVKGDLRLKRTRDSGFPNDKTLERFGSKRQLIAAALNHCRSNPGFEDVTPLFEQALPSETPKAAAKAARQDVVGSVYLLRSGRHYKIGKTNAFGRRERELAIQLPEKANTVHVIQTDDPEGIEAYWHTRFAAKRRHGEWFELDAADVVAFRRRKYQ